MQNANTTEPTRTEPEVPKDRADDTPNTKPLKLEAEPVEERIVPLMY